MRCLRRRRSFNGSGHDGVAAMRDGGPRTSSSYPFWIGMLFIWATLFGVASASDDGQCFMDDELAEFSSAESVCTEATTQPPNCPDALEDDPIQTPKKDMYDYDESEVVDDRPSIVFHNRAANKSYTVKYYEPSFCTCTETCLLYTSPSPRD